MGFKEIQLLILFLAVCISVGYAKPPKKIVGGESAQDGEFPYLVSIHQYGIHWCGGSLLDDTHILTAAHCVFSERTGVSSPESLLVVTGTNDNEDLRDDNVFKVFEVIYHEDYKPGEQNHTEYFADIAVLKLARPVPFNSHQKPIGLPSIDPPLGTLVVSSGWGTSYYVGQQGRSIRWLQKLKQKIISLAECQAAHPNKVNVGHICAVSPPGASTCHGDSGGPLVYDNQVVGLVSWGVKCADGLPDVFTNVYEFRDWIEWAMQ